MKCKITKPAHLSTQQLAKDGGGKLQDGCRWCCDGGNRSRPGVAMIFAMLEAMWLKMLMVKKYCDKCIFLYRWAMKWLIYELWQKWTTNRYQYKSTMVLELQVIQERIHLKMKKIAKGRYFFIQTSKKLCSNIFLAAWFGIVIFLLSWGYHKWFK